MKVKHHKCVCPFCTVMETEEEVADAETQPLIMDVNCEVSLPPFSCLFIFSSGFTLLACIFKV